MRSIEKSIRDRQREGLDTDAVIFIVAVSMFLVSVIVDMSLLGIDTRVTQVLRYAGYGIILYKLVKDIYDRNTLVKYLVIFSMLIVGYVFNHNKVMLLYSLVVLAAINIESELLIKIYFAVQGMILLIIVTMSQLGMVLDYVNKSIDRTRHYLGFDHATTAPILFLFMIMEYIYIKKGRLTILEYLVGMGIVTYFYKLTDTNMAFWICVATLTFFFAVQLWIDKGYITETFRYLLALSPWFAAALSIWAQYSFKAENATWLKLDEFFHSRLRLGYEAINTYGFSLFGRDITWIGSSFKDTNPEGYNYVDCSYLQIALQQGVIFLCIVLAMYSYIILKMIREKKYYGAWICVFISVFSMTEPRLVNVVFNPFVILALTIITTDVSEYVKRLEIKRKRAYG